MRTTRAHRGARPHVVGALAGCGLVLLACTTVVGAVGTVGAVGASSSTRLGTVVIPSPGPGYTISSQGPLHSGGFSADAPDPAAAEETLSSLAKSVSTYQRVWQGGGGRNQVQDLLVHFPDTAGAQAFLQAAQHSLDSGEVVGSDPLPSVPGARRITYLGSADRDGVGEAITVRVGRYVALLSFFSAASGDAPPISPTDAERAARAQHAALVAAPGGSPPATAGAGTKKGVSAAAIGVAVLAVAVLAVAVATPALLRRRRGGGPVPAAPVAPRSDRSGGDAVDDRRELGG